MNNFAVDKQNGRHKRDCSFCDSRKTISELFFAIAGTKQPTTTAKNMSNYEIMKLPVAAAAA